VAAGKRIVFLGPPNSGKGTQATILADRLGIPAISTGQMLRDAVAAGSALGQRVEGVMARGELVEDDLMADVVRARLAREDTRGGFLLDGYPRTAAQAATLQEILDGAGGDLDQAATLDVVVLIDAPEDVLVARALGRGREDDKEEIVRERLRVYRKKTAPLNEFYERKGLLCRINGDHSVADVSRAVAEAVGASAARSSSRPLVSST
jgi:adenylate kinase